ncbi:Carboxylic ester hydrolase [Cercospora zeina]
MKSSNVVTSLLALGSCQVASALSPTVSLNYATYAGSALSNGITQWLGMRFAAPPIGPLRFSEPQDPIEQTSNGTIPATEHGKVCLPTGDINDFMLPNGNYSEDCLFLDVFAPSNATKDSKLPVFFFISGGGFNSLSNVKYNGSGIIEAAEHDAVVVLFNYRVGPYGFLASKEIVKGGAGINNGLKDQRKALEWVQKYISHFGGNPEHVVIGGASAGAQSVSLQVTAYGGRDDGLFQGTAAESQSFPPVRSIEESQFAYDNLVIRTNCTASWNDTLGCLRNVSAADLQRENYNTPFPGAQEAALYMYGPTLDYDFIADYPTRAYLEGKFVRVPAIYGDDTNEGTVFTPKNTSSYGQSSTFLQNNFPELSIKQLGQINELYPVEDTPSFNGSGRYWRQAADAYGDLRYTCPGILVSASLVKIGVPSWNYHWNVVDPAAEAEGSGVQHTVEVHAIFGPTNTNGGAPASYRVGGVNEGVSAVVQGYWTSFIRTLDPNEKRVAGTPVWEEWTGTAVNGLKGRRLRFERALNATGMESPSERQQERCGYFASIGLSVKH